MSASLELSGSHAWKLSRLVSRSGGRGGGSWPHSVTWIEWKVPLASDYREDFPVTRWLTVTLMCVAGGVRTWHLHTMSASCASRSTTFPFPSSPHWAPSTTVTLLPKDGLGVNVMPLPFEASWLPLSDISVEVGSLSDNSLARPVAPLYRLYQRWQRNLRRSLQGNARRTEAISTHMRRITPTSV